MSPIRLPNSEYLSEEVLNEVLEKYEGKPYEESSQQHGKGLKPKDEITELVYNIDAYGKALTGRTPERLEEETGIPVEELFPMDAKILYVGDPWQRMGKELDESHGSNLTIIDYEYGEVASFERDDKYFRERIQGTGENLLGNLESMLAEGAEEYYGSNDTEWLRGFRECVEFAHRLSEEAQTDFEYLQASDAWGIAKVLIEQAGGEKLQSEEELVNRENEYPQEEGLLANFRADSWYTCVDGERGFKDLVDWKNIIQPKIVDLEAELVNLPELEREKIVANHTRDWIEEIRLKKHTEHSNIVEAVFPRLPFKEASFDRMVASWSISAHVFAELDEAGFEIFWDETHRVLTEGGKAYIFPLNYYYYVDQYLVTSLENMKKKYPDMDYEILDETGSVVEIDPINSNTYGYRDEYTLAIYKGNQENT